MTTFDDVAALIMADSGLAVVSTLRGDGTIQSSLVNAGRLAHPLDGSDVLGFVTYGPVKLANLRARPQVTATFRAGWRWATVEGRAALFGPDDGDLDADRVRLLLREVFAAAGGDHDDWDEYDRVMLAERRAGVLITPTRIYGS